MNICRKVNTIKSIEKKQIVDITDELNLFIKEKGIDKGTLIVQTLHTTMGLIVQELTEPRLCRDIIKHMESLFSSNIDDYEHNDLDERPEVSNKEIEPLNGQAHLESLVLPHYLSLDIWHGRLTLGKWQRVGILELDGPRNNRSYLIKMWKDPVNHYIFGKDFMDLNYFNIKKEAFKRKLNSSLNSWKSLNMNIQGI